MRLFKPGDKVKIIKEQVMHCWDDFSLEYQNLLDSSYDIIFFVKEYSNYNPDDACVYLTLDAMLEDKCVLSQPFYERELKLVVDSNWDE